LRWEEGVARFESMKETYGIPGDVRFGELAEDHEGRIWTTRVVIDRENGDYDLVSKASGAPDIGYGIAKLATGQLLFSSGDDVSPGR